MSTLVALLHAAVVLYPGFSDRPVGSNGWIRFMPAADTRIHYVSTNGDDFTAQPYAPTDGAVGDDPYNPTGSVLTYATIAAARSAARDGYPDWVLLKRGETWYGTSSGARNGRSAAFPSLLGAYGTGPRPVVKASSSTFGSICCSSRTNYAFVGLYLYAQTRDPDSPEYVSSAGGRGFRLFSGAGSTMEGVTIDDCVIRFFDTGIVIEGDGHKHDIVIRRNLILDSYSTAGHSQGMYASHTSALLEDNVFDHNGWLIQGYPPGTDGSDGRATMFNHNTYFSGCSTCVFRGNLFLRGASMGNKWRADSPGASRHIVLENNLYFEGELGSGMGGNTSDELRFGDVHVVSNVFTDVGTPQPTGRTLGWYLGISDWDGGSVSDNLFIHQTNETVGNVYGIHINAGSTRNVSVFRNTFYGIHSSRGLIELNCSTNMSGIAWEHNEVQSPIYGNRLVESDATLGAFTFQSNSYYSSTAPGLWFQIGGTDAGIAGWETAFSEAGAVTQAVIYPYPERTVYTYLESLGRPNTAVEFITAVRSQSRENWNTNFTAFAINNYLRRGFARLRVTTTNLPNGIAGQTYEYALQHCGGRESNWWTLAQGSLPEGLALAADGVIDGMPTSVTSCVFTAMVADTSGAHDYATYTLAVVPEPALACCVLACGWVLCTRRQASKRPPGVDRLSKSIPIAFFLNPEPLLNPEP